MNGKVRFSTLSPTTRHELAFIDVPVTIPAGATSEVQSTLFVDSAEIWDLDTPHIYRLRAEWKSVDAKITAARETDFGFRRFAVEGIGKNAIFRLNGRRIRIYTAISWGFWALNGLFPSQELAEKEVRVAKQFNLNTLNFHRNLGKEDVLYAQDRLGLLRCLEPGGGAKHFYQVKMEIAPSVDTWRRRLSA